MSNNKILIEIKHHLGFILGAGTGWALSWEQILHSIFTVITACTVTVATFFINRFLSKKFPKHSKT